MHMSEVMSGIVAAVLLIIITAYLNKYFTTRLLAAAILVAIAFIYVGFVLKGNSISLITLEILMAIMFFFLAMIGYKSKPQLLAIGIILHGTWDIFHHKGLIVSTDIPFYWPVFCMTIDVIYGIYLLFLLRKTAQTV